MKPAAIIPTFINQLSLLQAVLVVVLFMAAIELTLVNICRKIPDSFYIKNIDRGLFKIRSWEHGGKIYKKFGVHKWKKSIPDGARMFGDFSKKHLSEFNLETLTKMQAEMARGELVHHIVLFPFLMLFLFIPIPIAFALFSIMLILNGMCIISMRYTRPRLSVLIEREQRKLNLEINLANTAEVLAENVLDHIEEVSE